MAQRFRRSTQRTLTLQCRIVPRIVQPMSCAYDRRSDSDFKNCDL